MGSLYSEEHRALQDEFDTRKLADFLDKHHVQHAIGEQERGFIESRDMFFLSTVDHEGNPTVSYKGGPTGFVRVVGSNALAFPGYDGNGMFLSMGNIAGQGKVGMLFIDFETPHRLRVQGTARVVRDDPLRAEFEEAQYIVHIDVAQIWVNCPRYIHPHKKLGESRYVPKRESTTPLAQWKRLDMVQEVIADEDRARAEKEGVLDLEAYGEKLMKGEA
ncbi:pyridoxamine 5'-phosphate oxidase family protein [Methylobacterium sp. C25]|uniref:pyridoxamine 5'-phosphate oxidase family protein n=1 Tax=Methylobacterium sp. C25 TaxID=2721622 RepID=UPI001F48A8A1|nr:pyridoxamine 5'-phosphate oxidase family protein [Methylobacterium sp. C25]MCE4223817.1 pyridoxamine 5'-phosphate oxidase family protein [Methylobacterium sp. C25]